MTDLVKNKERFMSKVEKTKTCWIYLGYKNKGGYGHFWADGKNVYAHRFSYEINKGKIPSDLVIDHLCRNRGCVNPNHMEVVTLAENSIRGVGIQNNLKKTECKNGHPFTKGNTYIHKTTGERVCRKCKAILQRKYNKQKNHEN